MAAENTVQTYDESEMSVWDHIAELRTRMIWGFGALILTTLLNVAYLGNYFVDLLCVPIGGRDMLIAIEVTEPVGVYMRVSLLAGFIMALPIIVYEILAYVIPGLYDNEKRWVLIAVPLATLLFIGGVAFSYYIMLPAALPFLLNFMNQNGEGIQTMPRVSTYIGFVTNLMFWIGLSFETPLVMFLLAKFHVVTAGFMLKQWRFALVIIALMAAVITPTIDPVNMGLLMAPLFGIYLLSIGFAALATGGAEKEEE